MDTVDIDHAWVYGTHAAEERPMVQDFLAALGDIGATVYPLIDWHRKHRSLHVDGYGDVFLYETAIPNGAVTVNLPVHGAAPHEDWLQGDTAFWIIRHRGQFLFLSASALRDMPFTVTDCPYRSSARYMKIPLGSPEHRGAIFAHVL